MRPEALDRRVLAACGVGMLALAAQFLWRDLEVQTEFLVVLASVFAAGLAIWAGRKRALVGPLALLACSVSGGLWYAASRAPLLLFGLAATCIGSAIAVAWSAREATTVVHRVHNVLLWHGLVVSVLISTSAFYFQWLTLGVASDQIARRLVLTLVWLVAGGVLMVLAQHRREVVIRDAGFVFIAAALAKALFYDSTHLGGALRIAEFAVTGALLFGAAWAVGRGRKGSQPC